MRKCCTRMAAVLLAVMLFLCQNAVLPSEAAGYQALTDLAWTDSGQGTFYNPNSSAYIIAYVYSPSGNVSTYTAGNRGQGTHSLDLYHYFSESGTYTFKLVIMTNDGVAYESEMSEGFEYTKPNIQLPTPKFTVTGEGLVTCDTSAYEALGYELGTDYGFNYLLYCLNSSGEYDLVRQQGTNTSTLDFSSYVESGKSYYVMVKALSRDINQYVDSEWSALTPLDSGNEDLTEEQIEQLRAFIGRLYTDALGRSGYAEEEIDYWYQKLVYEGSDGANVAYGFFFSEEFTAKNLSDEEYLEVLYRVMFDRAADAEGKAYWLEKLAIGMSREYVYAGFANSTEFANVCGTYGVEQGSITSSAYRDQNEGVTAFVTRLYSKVLGRSGDVQGMEDWCRIILQKERTVETVAYGFVFSEEFCNYNTSNEEFVKILYQTFLDREYDAEGLKDWVGKLDEGADRELVFQGFARSTEFTNLMEEYGISPY